MTPELWKRLKPLFYGALEVGPEKRSAFVDAACGDDIELKIHLRQLRTRNSRIPTHEKLHSPISIVSSITTVLPFRMAGLRCEALLSAVQ
jgi:hypothetical protein